MSNAAHTYFIMKDGETLHMTRAARRAYILETYTCDEDDDQPSEDAMDQECVAYDEIEAVDTLAYYGQAYNNDEPVVVHPCDALAMRRYADDLVDSGYYEPYDEHDAAFDRMCAENDRLNAIDYA